MSKIETNPFVVDLIIDAGREVTDFYEYMRDKKAYDDSGNIPTIHLERANKVFIYTSPIIRLLLSKLSGSASKLYIWIQQSINYGEDFIKLNSKNFMKETKMSPSTLVKAKKELIDHHVIAKMKGENKYYWINPVIMFKGSRVKKYPDSISVFKGGSSNIISDSKIN